MSRLLAIILFVLAIAVMVHQFLVSGRIVDIDQILHHEFFASILFAFAAGLLAARSME